MIIKSTTPTAVKGNLPFCHLIKDFHQKKIKERANKENREINFQMTIDDIFAMSQENY